MSNGKHIRLTELDNSVTTLNHVVVPKSFYERILVGIKSVEEIFGGTEMPGFMKGTSVVLTGIPGTGKSTFALQLADAFQLAAGRNTLYNIGEESDKMLKLAADRIGLKGEFSVGKFEQVDALLEYCRDNGIEALFQDSLQSLLDGDLKRNARLASITKKLHNFAHDTDAIVVVIGHSTKNGKFAGPQEIVHDVDVHAHFRLNLETGNRILELEKNRRGPAHMPYEFFLSAHGLDLQAAPHLIQPEEEENAKPKASERRDQIVKLIRDKLMEGEEISGYCFERFNVDCSGGMWRVMLLRACEQLKREGFKIGEKKIGGRAHNFIDVEELK